MGKTGQLGPNQELPFSTSFLLNHPFPSLPIFSPAEDIPSRDAYLLFIQFWSFQERATFGHPALEA